jgi:uncharacterized protein YqjF (DUF2071 family)
VALPWLLRMRWLDLLFAHWPMPPVALQALLPAEPALELDLFDGAAWLGVVPFTMTDVAARGVPAVPRFSTFPELNVRTYVRHRGRPGVWFLSLDARSRPTVLGGRLLFHLPYHEAAMSSRRHGDTVDYHSVRAGGSARFAARYRPTGPLRPAASGSFDEWATHRMRLFSADRTGRIWRTEIDHAPWPLQPAEATIDAAEIVASHGLVLPDTPPILHVAARLDVHGWPPVTA